MRRINLRGVTYRVELKIYAESIRGLRGVEDEGLISELLTKIVATHREKTAAAEQKRLPIAM